MSVSGKMPYRASARGPREVRETAASVSVSDQQATSSARRFRDDLRVRDSRREEADLRQATAPRSSPTTAAARRAREPGVPVTAVSTRRKMSVSPRVRRLQVWFISAVEARRGPRRRSGVPEIGWWVVAWPHVGATALMSGWAIRATPTPMTWERRADSRKRRAPMKRSMAMPIVSRVMTPMRGLRRAAPAHAVSRLQMRPPSSAGAGSAASGLRGRRSGGTWSTAARAAVLSMRSPARTDETRPLRSQARVVRALAITRGGTCLAKRTEWESAWVDMGTSWTMSRGASLHLGEEERAVLLIGAGRGADQPSMKSRRAGPCAPMRHTRHPSMSCVCCAALAAAEGSRNLMPLDRVMMPSALSTAS